MVERKERHKLTLNYNIMEIKDIKRIGEECKAAGLSPEETLLYVQTDMSLPAAAWIQKHVEESRTVEDYERIFRTGQSDPGRTEKHGVADLGINE